MVSCSKKKKEKAKGSESQAKIELWFPRIRSVPVMEYNIQEDNGENTFSTLLSINSVRHPPDSSKYRESASSL